MVYYNVKVCTLVKWLVLGTRYICRKTSEPSLVAAKRVHEPIFHPNSIIRMNVVVDCGKKKTFIL